MSSASEASTGNQQGRKKSKDKNKELAVLVDEKVAEIDDSIITLTDRVDEMEKRIEELKSEGDVEELRWEMQVAVNSMATNVTKDDQALRASQDVCKAELEFYKVKVEAYSARTEALKAQLKACMAAVANMGVIGPSQVSPTLKGNALQTPTYNGARNIREIDNFFWGLETYFGATSITDEGQKVSHASFSLTDIALV